MGVTEIDSLAGEQYCYLTTTGRKTGRAHTIEIWFAAQPDSAKLYMLAGGRERADWVKNIGANPAVQVRIKSREFRGLGRVVTDLTEEQLTRSLVVKKYYGRDRVHTTGWEAESLPVAIDLKS
ncbi:MAG: nitroreductase family deazaflavin-dependent oxidoreductase [Chloroflexia bacterium]